MSQLALQLIAEAKRNNAKVLHLDNCGLTELPDELFELTQLEELNLGNGYYDDEFTFKSYFNYDKPNKIKKINSSLCSLTALKTLRICGDPFTGWYQIANYSFIEKMYWLESLNLSYNKISDISFLSNLKNLKSLNLNKNSITDISILRELGNLHTIYLSSNEINNVSVLGEIKGLNRLDLRTTKTSDIRFLEKLANIEALYLGRNPISDFSILSELKGILLVELNSSNISDISFIKKNTKLNTLHLSINSISDVSALKNLSDLNALYLNGNNISDITNLKYLTNLKELYLNGNHISDISALKYSTKLNALCLNDNYISDISCLKKLDKLKTLDLRSNQISDITPLKNFIEKGVSVVWKNRFQNNSIGLEKNPLKSPPPEIVKQGNQAILNWFSANKKALNELKLILIGDPQAGKTSILRRLKEDEFVDGEEQTDGINIESLVFKDLETFKNYPALKEVTAYCWDFGGQETMNATHQFFMTKRCVYVLVLNARKDNQVAQQVNNWVTRIAATGGDSSIIVLVNQIDKNTGFGFENEQELKTEFPQIKYFLKTSCKTGKGMEDLKACLAELIPQAELFNTQIDERWFPVKEKLQTVTAKNDFLNENRFRDICAESGIPNKEDQKELIYFLNDLGILLHFDIRDLAEYFVLDPYWLTYGIYQIITSKHVGENDGIINMNDLEYIINEEEDKAKAYKVKNYRKIKYSTNERRYLLDFLAEYKLAFKSHCDTKIIIPDVLTTKEPIKVSQPIRKTEDKIQFVYSYPYLPKSILPNFMADTNAMLIEYWRTGCVLKSGTETALVSSYNNRITIIVTGIHKQKREFLAIVRSYLERINNNQNQQPDRLIPLPGLNYEYADYDILIDKERDGEKFHRIYKPIKEKFEISALLEGIPTDNELQDKFNQMISNQEVIIKKLNLLGSTIQQNKQQIIEDIQQNFDEQNEVHNQQAEQLIDLVVSHLAKSNNPEKENTLGQLNGSLSTSAKLKLTIPLIPGLLKYETDLKFESKQGSIKSWKDVWHVFFKE